MPQTSHILTAMLVTLFTSATFAKDAAVTASLPSEVQAIISNRCLHCHGAETSEGDVRLDNLAELDLDARLELLNKVQEQLHFGLMPPKDEEQPTAAELAGLAGWTSKELNQHNASKLADKLRKPEYGNYVDHDKLFSGEYQDLKAFTYDRRWLISEFIFNAKFNRILNHTPTRTIDGQRQNVIGDNNRRVNLTNPFLLPTNTGVRYYASTTLDGGHLLTMITNAKEASAHMLYLAKRDRRYVPAIDGIMGQEWEHETILAARETFLNNFIDQVLRDLYQDKHEALLPEFVRAEVTSPVVESNAEFKKAPFHAAQPGQQELQLIWHSMQRHQADGISDEQLIERCEREWFNFGHNDRQIQARITFLNGYLPELRKTFVQHNFADKYKPLAYRAPAPEEMSLIGEAILKNRQPGDHYNTIIAKCLAQWTEEFRQQRIEAGICSNEKIGALVDQLFIKILERSPSAEENAAYTDLTRSYIESLGNLKAIEKLIQTLMLRSDFVYRHEFGQGEADEYGRKMLSPRDASYAIAYALTDSSPDAQLIEAANTGKLNTREDYQREVLRLLNNRDQYYIVDEAVEGLQLTSSFTNLPVRKLRFFREFFGYPQMLPIFKDRKRFGGSYDESKGRLVGEADQLVEFILQKDKSVLEELLTTENFYVYHSGDNESMAASSERIRSIYEYFKDSNWENFKPEDLKAHKEFINKVKMRQVNVDTVGSESGRQDSLRAFKTAMASFTIRFDKGQTAAAPFDSFPAHGKSNADTRTGLQLRSPEVAKFFNIDLANWNYPTTQPAPVAHRKGMLTHPAWLIAHAQNTETDPVKRGKWIQEKLLAGIVPDVPITVDAVIPEDHHKTLRERLEAKTGQDYCWKCHKKMNPLGLPFEMYDDFGRFRTEESLEHPDNLIEQRPEKGAPQVDLRDVYKTLPVNAKGYLDGTGDKTLDGEVNDAFDLIDRLSKSNRVRQSIIRYAFRYFMGRNEMLSDSKTLIDADQAYLNSGGSFDAVIVSLLTSDSFIYRKATEE